MRSHFAALVALALAVLSSRAQADQRRDFMLEGDPPGNFLMVDYFGTGGRATFEHRGEIYGKANGYALSVSGLIGFPLAQVVAHASLRVLFLEFGGSVGYRTLWRNLSFEPGDHAYCARCDRAARRHLDPIFGPGQGTDQFGFAEGHVQLYAPFNEYFTLTSLLAARYEGRAPRSYDWFFTDIHDGGVMYRWEAVAFFKHRDWGGIGPYVQLMILPRAGHHDSEWAVGFNATTRLGLLARNDLLFLTFLVRPGDRYYGQHTYFAPLRALLVYRMRFAL